MRAPAPHRRALRLPPPRIPGHMGIPSDEHIELQPTPATAHFPQLKAGINIPRRSGHLCDPQLLKWNDDCPISSFNKLLMKEIKIPSLTSASLFMKTLHKYISVMLSKCSGSGCFHFFFYNPFVLRMVFILFVLSREPY